MIFTRYIDIIIKISNGKVGRCLGIYCFTITSFEMYYALIKTMFCQQNTKLLLVLCYN